MSTQYVFLEVVSQLPPFLARVNILCDLVSGFESLNPLTQSEP